MAIGQTAVTRSQAALKAVGMLHQLYAGRLDGLVFGPLTCLPEPNVLLDTRIDTMPSLYSVIP